MSQYSASVSWCDKGTTSSQISAFQCLEELSRCNLLCTELDDLLLCLCSQKIDRAVSGRGTQEPEVEEVPVKKLSRATSKHQAVKAQIQEKYSGRTAPEVEMATK